MTCRKGQPCQQCDPVSDEALTPKGNHYKTASKAREARIEAVRVNYAAGVGYEGVGNLAYEQAHPDQVSHSPRVVLCDGCFARVMGRPT